MRGLVAKSEFKDAAISFVSSQVCCRVSSAFVGVAASKYSEESLPANMKIENPR